MIIINLQLPELSTYVCMLTNFICMFKTTKQFSSTQRLMICYLVDAETEVKRPVSEIQLEGTPSIAEYQEQWASDAAQVGCYRISEWFTLCPLFRILSGDIASPHLTLILENLSLLSLTALWRLFPGPRVMAKRRIPGTGVSSSVGCVTSSSQTVAMSRVTS